MRFVPVKSEAQQANAVVFRARDLLVRQRTQCINALRGHLAEYGHVVPQGPAHVDSLVALVEDPKSSVQESARVILKALIRTLKALGMQLEKLNAEIACAVWRLVAITPPAQARAPGRGRGRGRRVPDHAGR
jgi:transposase